MGWVFILAIINGEQRKLIIKSVTALGKESLKFPKKYNGFMGISIYNYFFNGKTMEKYICWGSENFGKFLVLLMDDPEVNNLHVFKGIGKKEALEKARSHSDSLKICFKKIINKNKINNVEIVQFRDFYTELEFTKFKKIVEEEFKKNKLFRDDVLGLMHLWIGDKIDSLEKIISPNNIKELSNYIIEELTSLFYFTEKGYRIELDPTPEFSTKKKVYNGIFKEIKEKMKLKKRGHIYLHPEGIEKYGKKKIKEILKKLQ